MPVAIQPAAEEEAAESAVTAKYGAAEEEAAESAVTAKAPAAGEEAAEPFVEPTVLYGSIGNEMSTPWCVRTLTWKIGAWPC